MRHLYTFFIRLLIAFLAAKFLTRHFGLEGLVYWLGLTLAFLANVYFFEYLHYRGHSIFRRRTSRRDTPASATPPPSEETPQKPDRPGL